MFLFAPRWPCANACAVQVCDLTLPTGFYVSQPREASNTAFDFLAFVVELIAQGVLSPGDVFVCDNASVHWSEEIAELMDDILDAAQV